MWTLQRLDLDRIDWSDLDRFEDRMFSQRREWLDFITAFVNGEIVVAAVERSGERVGYFTGILFRRLGVPILGSPFRGWTTPYMGFNLHPDLPRKEALGALERFAFQELGCLHLEMTDRYIGEQDGLDLGFHHHLAQGYLSDLSLDEDVMLGRMKSACRRAIRKAGKEGVVVEEADPEGFADEYHRHLSDVFAKQNLTPTYGPDRVQKLIEHLHPSGCLLLARARHPNGQSIATGIYPGYGGNSFFWGNGSWRTYQHLRPNEALHWFAMRHWKAQGSRVHDWGGKGTYKAKYGTVPFTAHAFRKSRWAFVEHAREAAETIYHLPRRLRTRRMKLAG